MYQHEYKYITLACFFVCVFLVLVESSDGSSVYYPSDTSALTCNGYQNCSSDACNFNNTLFSMTVTEYFPSAVTAIPCGDMILNITFPPAENSSLFGTYTTLCFKYTNSKNNSFYALEIAIEKANTTVMNSTYVECLSTNCNASLMNETSEGITVVGISSIGCTPYVQPRSSPSVYLPSNTPKLTCNDYENCTSDACNFNSALKDNYTSGYFSSTDMIFHCGVISLEIVFPFIKNKSEFGTFTVLCFEYKSNQNATFDALQITVQKPRESLMNSTKAVCNSVNCEASLLNETSNEITIVALISFGCTPPAEVDVPSSTESSMYLPSETPELSCKGLTNCTNDFCDFKSTLKSKDLSGYFPSMDVLYHCGAITLEIVFPPAENNLLSGTTTAMCYKYTDSNNVSFDALQVTARKAENSEMNSTNATCLSSNCEAHVLNESSDEITIVALQTNQCKSNTRPTPASSVCLPSETPQLICKDFGNCTSDTCNFNRSLKSNDTFGYFPSVELVSHCGVIDVDIKLPPNKDESAFGTYTPLCYTYANSNNMTFNVLQLMVKKAQGSEMNETAVTCGTENCIAKLVNETSDDITIVAMLFNGCTPHFIPTF